MNRKLEMIDEVEKLENSIKLRIDLTKYKEGYYLTSEFGNIITQYLKKIQSTELELISEIEFEYNENCLTLYIKILSQETEIHEMLLSQYVYSVEILLNYLKLYIVDLKIHSNVVNFLNTLGEENQENEN